FPGAGASERRARRCSGGGPLVPAGTWAGDQRSRKLISDTPPPKGSATTLNPTKRVLIPSLPPALHACLMAAVAPPSRTAEPRRRAARNRRDLRHIGADRRRARDADRRRRDAAACAGRRERRAAKPDRPEVSARHRYGDPARGYAGLRERA